MSAYKIVQFTDLHIGSTPFNDDDLKTIDNLETSIERENPDLIVLTGDNIWSSGVNNPLEGYDLIYKTLNKYNIPVAVTYGNHDSEEKVTRSQLRDYEINLKNVIKKENVFVDSKDRECYTYDVMVGGEFISRLYFIDTGNVAEFDFHSYDYISKEQIEWYEEVYANNQTKGNDYLFMHIPLPEYEQASYHIIDGVFWEWAQDGVRICSPKLNSGLFFRMYENKHIKAVFCGHDHDNNFEGVYLGIHLTYGNVSGYNTYGQLPRGYRVIELDEKGFTTRIGLHE